MIRIDDFPQGDKNMYLSNPNMYLDTIEIISILEEYGVDYIWGVSPLLCNENHCKVLSKIKNGKIVMHGFDHGFSKIDNWSTCTKYWKSGGEFCFYTKDELIEQYHKCNTILSQFSSYDDIHFIPPFNCFTQDLLDVLQDTNVQYIYTCDQEWTLYNQENLHFGKIKAIISELYKSYNHLDEILKKFDSLKSMITLHWIYDIQKSNWKSNYMLLSEKLINRKQIVEKYESINHTRKWTP